MLVGWIVVGLYAAALALVTIQEVSGDASHPQADGIDPAEAFAVAWEDFRQATFVATGTYERRSEVTGAVLSSEDVVAQRPPRRLHRQLGGVDGRDDDRLIVCPAPPADEAERVEPCRLGPPSGVTYAESVEREVAGLRSLTQGRSPLYRVTQPEPGCFALELLRIDPRAPFGVDASFCFASDTGALVARRVRHEGGIVEVLTVTSVRTEVTDADLEP